MPSRTLTSKPVDPEITALAERYHADPEAILAILQELQARHGGLTRAAIADVARALRLPVERAYGVATFYSMLNSPPRPRPTIRVCDGPACWLNSAQEARAAVEAEFGREWAVERTSCLGLCDRAPAALMDGQPFGPLLAENVLVERSRWLGEPKAYARPRPGEVRLLLARAGTIDPDALDSALEHGAYTALLAALNRPPEAVIAEVEAAGLTGRGGAGFPAGRKWRMVAQESRSPKYIVCNADESEPLVFKDRVLIDSDPHQLLEGMALAGYAVGAREGFIYIRGEYEPQAARLERAIQQAETHGWLGESIRWSNVSFHIHVHRGAGAYICGEETALFESIEGKRGFPRVKPPFPTTHGLFGKPTAINNVETLAAIPYIVTHGAAAFRQIGTEKSTGPKLFCVSGDVAKPGLYEAPFGVTIRHLVNDLAGGVTGGKLKAILFGGAAGAFATEKDLDVKLTFEDLRAAGLPLGSGVVTVFNQTRDLRDVLVRLARFFAHESCGKCYPCQLGTQRQMEILERLAAGEVQSGDRERLSDVGWTMTDASLCGLGQTAAWAVQSAMKNWPEMFDLT